MAGAGPVTAHLQPCGGGANGSSLLQFRYLLSAPIKATLNKAEYDFPDRFRPLASPAWNVAHTTHFSPPLHSLCGWGGSHFLHLLVLALSLGALTLGPAWAYFLSYPSCVVMLCLIFSHIPAKVYSFAFFRVAQTLAQILISCFHYCDPFLSSFPA